MQVISTCGGFAFRFSDRKSVKRHADDLARLLKWIDEGSGNVPPPYVYTPAGNRDTEGLIFEIKKRG